jgi:hypothetical protein
MYQQALTDYYVRAESNEKDLISVVEVFSYDKEGKEQVNEAATDVYIGIDKCFDTPIGDACGAETKCDRHFRRRAFSSGDGRRMNFLAGK